MLRWLIAALLVLQAAPALADELRPGLLMLEQREAVHWDISWKEPLSATTGPPSAAHLPAIPEQCSFDEKPVMRLANQALLGRGALTCAGDLTGERFGYPGLAPNAEMLMRVVPLDEEVQLIRLNPREPFGVIAAPEQAAPVWQSYIALGIEHILAGWDHLLFVIALVLLVRRWKSVALAVTAFTVAHSITLAGTTLGFLGLPARPVEALIALSIVLLAVELVRNRQSSLTLRFPWAVAFLFGLIHGFGFAGALREIGLPEGDVVAALLAFNVGVEAGQLMVVAAVLALRWALGKLAPLADAPAIKLASYAIGITGSYWLIDRLIG